MFGWLRRSSPPVQASDLHWDCHAHLLAQVDDGASSPAESIAMLQALASQGYRGAVCTSHIWPGLFDNSEKQLRDAFSRLAPLAQELDFAVQLGAEYMAWDGLVQRIRREPSSLLTFGNQLLLVEFMPDGDARMVDRVLDACLCANLTLVVAHPERYPFTWGREGLELAAAWKDRGALLQQNLRSSAGGYGPQVRRAAMDHLKANLPDLLGSDLHRAAHNHELAEGLAVAGRHAFPAQRQAKWLTPAA
jgi:tyrosine-protein phosphatase YwqE